MTAPRMVSRLWVRKHDQPRDSGGRFLRGSVLYTRWDGQTRWLKHFGAPEPLPPTWQDLQAS